MPQAESPDISHFPKIVEIQVLWINFSDEVESYCLYRAETESIEWINSSKVLRFDAICVEGGEDDIELTMQFRNGIFFRYDLEDAGPVAVPMQWFEGPSGLICDYRTRTECLSVLIKPAQAAVRQKKAAKASS